MTNRKTALPTVASTIMCLCLYGCGAASSTYLVSGARVEQQPGARLSMLERMGYGRPDRTIMAGGVAVVVQPSNAIMTSDQRERILFVFNSVRKINPEEYRFQPFYYENSVLNTREPFVVEFLFSTGSHDAIFDAMATFLEDGKGNKYSPVSIHNLEPVRSDRSSPSDRSKWIVSRQCTLPEEANPYWIMHSVFLQKYERKPPDPMALGKGGLYCLAVKFGIPPLDPRSSFTITINDLSVDGQKVPVPDIFFVPGTLDEVRP